jgi:hypothetical protein
VRRSVALGIVALLSACNFKVVRPPQENFTLRAPGAAFQRFASVLGAKFGTSPEAAKIRRVPPELGQMYQVDGSGVMIMVVSVPDDRCNPNAPVNATYNDGEYRVDLVYHTKNAEKRSAAKRMLLQSAKEAGQSLKPFKEC